MKTLIITGATGFTGKFLLKEALKNDYKIIALVRKSSNVNYLKKNNIDYIEVDLDHKVLLLQELIKLKKENGNPDLIIHNAGVTKARRKEDYLKGNADLTLNFINSLIDVEIIPKKFIYTSSLAALGPGDALSLAPISEEQTQNPITFYGESKFMAEKFIKLNPEFPWIIIRPTAVYGPGDGDTLMLFKGIKMGIEMSVAKMEQQLSFIYEEDMAKAYFEVAEKSSLHETYNLSDGNNYSSGELNSYLKKVMDKKTIKVKINPNLLKTTAIISEVVSLFSGKSSILSRNKVNELKEINWKVDPTKIQEIIGFRAETFLEEGLEKTFKWYKENGWI